MAANHLLPIHFHGHGPAPASDSGAASPSDFVFQIKERQASHAAIWTNDYTMQQVRAGLRSGALKWYEATKGWLTPAEYTTFCNDWPTFLLAFREKFNVPDQAISIPWHELQRQRHNEPVDEYTTRVTHHVQIGRASCRERV